MPHIEPSSSVSVEARRRAVQVRRRAWHRVLGEHIRGRLLVAIVSALGVSFLALTIIVFHAGLQPMHFDREATTAIQRLPQPIGQLLIAVSIPGFEPWNWLVPMSIAAVLLVLRRTREVVFTLLAWLSGLVSEVIKHLVDRPRPTELDARIFHALHSYSFPSGHVTLYVAYFGFLFYLVYISRPSGGFFRRLALVVLGALIALVGISRVYMGQHWVSDAMAGYALGFGYLLVLIQGWRIWVKRHPVPLAEASLAQKP